MAFTPFKLGRLSAGIWNPRVYIDHCGRLVPARRLDLNLPPKFGPPGPGPANCQNSPAHGPPAARDNYYAVLHCDSERHGDFASESDSLSSSTTGSSVTSHGN